MYVSFFSSPHYNIVISITNAQFAQVCALGKTSILRECGRADADGRLPDLFFVGKQLVVSTHVCKLSL